MRYLAVASPGFAAEHLPPGSAPEVWSGARLVAFDRHDTLQDRFLAALGVAATRSRRRATSCRPRTRSSRWSRPGSAGAPCPRSPRRRRSPRVRLVDLAPGRWLDVPLFWQRWKVDAAVLAALTERVVGAASAGLRPGPVGARLRR